MRWEYTTAQLVAAGFEHEAKNDDYLAALQQLGADGWELVSAVTYPSPLAREDAVILFFKRPAGPPTPTVAESEGQGAARLPSPEVGE